MDLVPQWDLQHESPAQSLAAAVSFHELSRRCSRLPLCAHLHCPILSSLHLPLLLLLLLLLLLALLSSYGHQHVPTVGLPTLLQEQGDNVRRHRRALPASAWRNSECDVQGVLPERRRPGGPRG